MQEDLSGCGARQAVVDVAGGGFEDLHLTRALVQLEPSPSLFLIGRLVARPDGFADEESKPRLDPADASDLVRPNA
jgi:hypothetical protein